MDLSLVHKIEKSFESEFGTDPKLVFSPGRINLIGEHVDYNDGFVFPAAIDTGIAVAIQKAAANQNKCTAIAFDFEETFSFWPTDSLPLENGGWRNFLIGIVAELKKIGCNIEPFNIMFGGNIPVGAGLSSSAALENGIVYSLNELFGLGLSKMQMVKISQTAEHLYVGVQCGIMDQYASMFGEENHFLLLDCRTLDSTKFRIDLKGFKLILINTNVHHNLSDSTYNKRRTLCEKVSKLLNKKALRDVSKKELQHLGDHGISEEDYRKVLYVIEEIQRTQRAGDAIKENNIAALGDLLFETHDGLSKQYEVSCDELDYLVALAKESEYALGARMIGGGFGGCTLNIIREEFVDHFIEHTQKSYAEKFGHDCSPIKIKLSKGTHLVS